MVRSGARRGRIEQTENKRGLNETEDLMRNHIQQNACHCLLFHTVMFNTKNFHPCESPSRLSSELIGFLIVIKGSRNVCFSEIRPLNENSGCQNLFIQINRNFSYYAAYFIRFHVQPNYEGGIISLQAFRFSRLCDCYPNRTREYSRIHRAETNVLRFSFVSTHSRDGIPDGTRRAGPGWGVLSRIL